MINRFFKRYCFEITRQTLLQLERTLLDISRGGIKSTYLDSDVSALIATIRLIETMQRNKNF